MPKAARKRPSVHQSSARSSGRQFAAQENVVERVNVGEAAGVSATEILHELNAESQEALPQLKKKEKQQLKKELFLQRLEGGKAPYSKSAAKRQRRREKQQLAGGMGAMESALAAVVDDLPAAVKASMQETAGSTGEDAPSKRRSVAPRGLIGEGKSTPLTQAQRKRALQTERLRMPIVRKDPNFAANPFAAIRTHAQNTLIKHQPTV